MKHEPRFILRRTTPEQQLRGGQFELLRAAEPDRPLQVTTFSGRSARRPYYIEIEALEAIPGLEPIWHHSPPGDVARFGYRITLSDIRREDI